MLIHPAHVSSLKALYRTEYHADLTDDEAWDLALHLTTLVRLVRKVKQGMAHNEQHRNS